jgi:spermidine synthase
MLKITGGRCIHDAENGIKVYQNPFYRWLTFGSPAIQTLINRRHLERPGLSYINYLKIPLCARPGDSCLLGLGGAGIAHAVAPYIGTSSLLAVEHDAHVIKIANDFFMSNRLKNLAIVHQDAEKFVRETKTYFQHLIVDLYGAVAFPEHCNTPEFFESCRGLLDSEGVLAVNIANCSEHKPILEHIKSGFSSRTVLLPVKGTSNLIILACKGPTINPLLNLIKKNNALKKLTWDAQWGCVAQLHIPYYASLIRDTFLPKSCELKSST